ncbi:hypothetical protein COO60DRAFT_58353 [Scenedesmus sp. NREL 46B-D3]|nr:hypothetical protein COO60DRAFT_58353 [Scenedesmus sp. NREL 46B-D3]
MPASACGAPHIQQQPVRRARAARASQPTHLPPHLDQPRSAAPTACSSDDTQCGRRPRPSPTRSCCCSAAAQWPAAHHGKRHAAHRRKELAVAPVSHGRLQHLVACMSLHAQFRAKPYIRQRLLHGCCTAALAWQPPHHAVPCKQRRISASGSSCTALSVRPTRGRTTAAAAVTSSALGSCCWCCCAGVLRPTCALLQQSARNRYTAMQRSVGEKC